MIRRILPFFITAAVFLLDTALLPVFTHHWLLPVFSLVVVQCYGLLLGRSRGLMHGIILGLLVDISVSTPFGLMTVIYALMGYMGGWFKVMMWRSRLVEVISGAACFAAYELLMDIYVTFFSAQLSGWLFVYSLVRVPMYAALVFLFCRVLDWLLKPSHSRFARH